MNVRKLVENELRVGPFLTGIDDHFGILIRLPGLGTGAAAQKIQRSVVRDAEQPALGLRDALTWAINSAFVRLDCCCASARCCPSVRLASICFWFPR